MENNYFIVFDYVLLYLNASQYDNTLFSFYLVLNSALFFT